MRRLLLGTIFALASTVALAQVRQSGNVTPGHAVKWLTTGVVGDAGAASAGGLTTLGVTANGPGAFCINSGPITAPYNQFCFGATTNGGSRISSYALGGATTPGITFDINGTTQGFLTVQGAVAADDLACFADTTGSIKHCGSPPPLTVGTTTISGGTSGRVLYDNAGLLGEYAISGSGTTVAMTTAPTFVTSITAPLVIGGAAAGSTLTLESTSGTGTTDSIIFKTGSQTTAGTFEAPVTAMVPTAGSAPYPLIMRAGTACAGSSVYTTPGIGPAPSNGQLFICADQATSAAGNFSGIFATAYNSGTRYNAAVTGIGVMPAGAVGGNAWGGQFSAVAQGNAGGVLQGANIEADWSTGTVTGIALTLKLGDSAGGSTASPGNAYIYTLADAGKAPLYGWRLDANTRTPIAATGSVIKIEGANLSATGGIDLSAGTFSGNAFASPGFSVSGLGVTKTKTVAVRSTGAAFDLIITANTAFTADRTLTINLGDTNRTFQPGGDIITAGALTLSGAFGFTGTLTNTTSVTFPTAGTLATTSNKLSAFAATTSAELAGVISDETGSGLLVFATSPTLTTPVLGVASATSINKVAITAPATSSTLTIADGKTLTVSNTLTFAGTDSSTLNIGTGGTLGTAAYKNTGTSGNVVPLLDGANNWSADNVFNSTAAAGQPVGITLTQASATVGPVLPLTRIRASPAANDQIGAIIFYGSNSTPTNTPYAEILTTVTDPTAGTEDAVYDFLTQVAGTLANRVRIGAGLMIGTTTDPGAGSLQVNTKIFAPNLATTTAALAAALCWTVTTGEFQRDTNAGGCLVSAGRYKHDIADLPPMLNEVMAMRPVSFLYNGDVGIPGPQIGFIADEMARVEPRMVGFNPNGEAQSVRYMQMTAILVKAVQELKAEIDDLKQRIP